MLTLINKIVLIGLFLSIWQPLAHAQTMAVPQNNQAWLRADFERLNQSNALPIDRLNISGLVANKDFIALASDEGHQIVILTASNKPKVISLTKATHELDIEGLAWQTPYLYAIGSHGLKRKRLKNSASIKQNLNRLQAVVKEPARYQLFRIELDPHFNAIEVQSLSLSKPLLAHPLLERFTKIPSKENGIDIEGLSIDAKGRLLVGFRGPVLRGNLTPVLQIKLGEKRFKIRSLKTRYINLGGSGIRGMDRMQNDTLILTGATGDANIPYEVFIWQGKHALQTSSHGNLQRVCQLPKTLGKPEAIQFISRTVDSITFLIAQDGLDKGDIRLFKCDLI